MTIRFTIVAEPKKAVSRVWLQLAELAGAADTEARSSRVEHMLVIEVTIFVDTFYTDPEPCGQVSICFNCRLLPVSVIPARSCGGPTNRRLHNFQFHSLARRLEPGARVFCACLCFDNPCCDQVLCSHNVRMTYGALWRFESVEHCFATVFL